MQQFQAGLKTLARGVQPVVTAWLVVALLLPVLLGLVPSAQASPAAELMQVSELQLCAKLGHLPDETGKAPKGQHTHDCPCCLPGAVGLAALTPSSPFLLPSFLDHSERLALAEFNLRRLVGQSHHLAPARAPPRLA